MNDPDLRQSPIAARPGGDALDSHPLQLRIAILERKIRRLTRALGATSLLCIAIWTIGMGQEGKRVIEASAFQVVDDGGKTLAQLGSSAAGAELMFYGKEKDQFARLFHEKDALGLTIAGEEKSGLSLTIAGSTPELFMSGGEGKPGIRVRSSANGAIAVFQDGKGNSRLQLGLDKAGAPFFEMRDENNKTRVRCAAEGETTLLALYKQDGKLAWQAGK